jgi:hypothetical protein
MSDWDKWFEEIAAENRRQSIASEPGAKAKSEAERRRHIELGWITEDGEPGPNAPQDDENEDEDEEDSDQ